MTKKRSFWDKFWRDERGHDVIWQRPNKLLIIWFTASVINVILRGGVIENVLGWIGLIAILLWSALELAWGVNYFRRLLGFCVLVIVIFSRIL